MDRFRVGLPCAVLLVMLIAPHSAAAAGLTIAWDPQTAVAGYSVSYGTASGVYTFTVDVGLQTQRLISGLADGQRYYFIVRSYDASGAMSPPSVEVSGLTAGNSTPTIRCPAPSATSPDGKSMALTFAPTVSGGTAPLTTTCTPASGSLFPVGTTPLSCGVTDALTLTSTCSSVVTVTSNVPALALICPIIPTATVAKNGSNAKVTYDAPTVVGGVAPVTTTCSP